MDNLLNLQNVRNEIVRVEREVIHCPKKKKKMSYEWNKSVYEQNFKEIMNKMRNVIIDLLTLQEDMKNEYMGQISL